MNRTILSLFASLLVTGLPATGSGQNITQLAVPESPAFEAAAEPLRKSPPQQFDFEGAMMVDVMRLLASEAGISFFGLPEGASGADRLVTFSINASPFTALETLARANGISLIFENGIWYLRPADDTELVGRIYQVNYNPQEMVTKNDQAGSLGSGGGGGQGSNSGAGSIGLNLQGAPNFFVTEPSRLLEGIREILDLPTTGRNATFAPSGSVDTLGQFALGQLQGQPDVFVRTNTNNGTGAAGDSTSSQAKVIWNSDSNSLYVVATRQQHQWIEGYLAAADQPQPLVAVEVKFLEINKDPQTELGIDWTGTLSGGWGATIEGTDGAIAGPLSLDRVGDYTLPTAILSYDDVNLRLRSLFNDRKNRTVSYPRMITLDNREVSFRSVINQPVLSSSASTSLGAGATETNSVEYIPIGTVINILPKRLSDEKVLLNVSITVSDIIGTEVINGNPFPIASSRVYTAPINVESGYTVAISGLDSAEDDKLDQGVPVLGKIPVLGYAFKYRGEQRSRQHLMMLITPTLINPRDPGVPERPTIRDPWGPNIPEFDPFADDVLPHDEQDFWDKRKEKKKAREASANSVPQYPMMNPVPAPGTRGAHFSNADPGPASNRAYAAAAPAHETEFAPAWATDPDQANEAKSGGLFARIFGKNKGAVPQTPAGIATGPVPGDDAEVVPMAPETTANPAPPTHLLADVDPLPIPGPSSPSSPAAAKPANPAPQSSGGGGKLRWDGTRLAGGTAAVPDAVDQLEQNLAEAQNGDPSKVAAVRADTNRLLQYVNDLRDEGTISVNGELSDEWWTLIKLKTQANALSRSNAPVMVDNTVEP